MSKERRPQHGKNRSRPRSWHRGRKTGKQAVPILASLEAAEARATGTQSVVVSENRALAVDAGVWHELEHTDPHVPSFEAAL